MIFVLIASVSSHQCWQSSRTAGRRRTTRGCRSCSSSCSTTCPATWRQGCGSAFISSGSGSGSSSLGWIWYRSGSGSGSRALMSKNWQKITAGKKLNFFGIKTTIYLSLGLHKERPSYRRSLQLSKEAIQHFRTWTFKKNFYFWGSFLLSWIRIRIPNPDPIRIRIRIRNPACRSSSRRGGCPSSCAPWTVPPPPYHSSSSRRPGCNADARSRAGFLGRSSQIFLPANHLSRNKRMLAQLVTSVLRIHEILVWIRIRGSIPLTNGPGSGSGCGSGSCSFLQWPSRCHQKIHEKS